jgi:hypothetical protein
MRTCPVCNWSEREYICDQKPALLFECFDCCHRYLDRNDWHQAWFDNYYLTEYEIDDKPYSEARLSSLADCIAEYSPYDVLDIGGMDGELQRQIENRMIPCTIAGVGTIEKAHFGAVVLSHVLEHIYDMPLFFERVKKSMARDGLLFIEVPIHPVPYLSPDAYDVEWQHVNKFRPIDLERLVGQNGFIIIHSDSIARYREYACWRLIGYARG